MTLLYFAIGSSLIPLLDTMFSKKRPLSHYGVYIGFWIGVWSSYLISKVMP